MTNTIQFTGKTKDGHKEIYGCTDCGSRSFKLMTYGASKEIIVRCANCEANQSTIKVEIADV